MNEANLGYINLGDRRYPINLLNPYDGIDWGNRALELFGPVLGEIVKSIDFDEFGELDFNKIGLWELAAKLRPVLGSTLNSLGQLKNAEVSAMQKEALQRCYTPENEPLSNMVVFNKWFRQYPGDMHPLGWMALVTLVKDFFPSQLVTTASGFLEKMTSTQGTPSQSPKAGKHAHS